jgi:nicotinate dehydrogenase medium molybdopterin subunit
LLDLAAAELKAPVDRLVMAGDAIVDPVSGGRTTVGALASATYGKGQLVGTGSCATAAKAFDRVRSIGSIWGGIANPAYFAQAAEVEVDPDTGAVTVLRVATAQDVGYAISRTAIDGQIHGGVMQGIGQALFEEIVTADGHVVNGTLGQYGIPTIHEMTEHAIEIIESRKDEGLDGVKGVGEHPNCALPAAIANAVCEVTGRRPTRLPLRGEDVLGG